MNLGNLRNLGFNHQKSFYSKQVKKILFLFLSLIVSISLLCLTVNTAINLTLLNGNFHERLLLDKGMWKGVEPIILEIADDFNVSPDIVRFNIQPTIGELFDFIKGNKDLLPDIYIDNAALSFTGLDAVSVSSIDKLNLSTILLFFNKANIFNSLFTLRDRYKYLRILHSIIFLISILLVSVMLNNLKGSKDSGKYLKLIAVLSASFSIATAIIVCLYSRIRLDAVIFELLTEDLPQNIKISLTSILTAYTKSCIDYVTLFITIFGGIPMFFCTTVYFLKKIFRLKGALLSMGYTYKKFAVTLGKITRLLKNHILFFIVGLISVLLIQKIDNLRNIQGTENLIPIFSKSRSFNLETSVILAGDENIYPFRVFVIDETTGNGIQGIKVVLLSNNINSGMDSVSLKDNRTDNNGVAEFFINKGIHYINLCPLKDGSEYCFPSPFSINTDEAQDNTIKIYLSRLQ